VKSFEILVVVRHPVGGIRSFLRYVYRNFGAARYRFTIAAPRMAQTDGLLEDLRALDVRSLAVDPARGMQSLFDAVWRTLRSERYDLVHSQGFGSAMISAPGAMVTRTPHVVTCHDVVAEGQLAGIAGLAKRLGLATVLATADRVHCVGEDARENLLAHLHLLQPFAAKVIAIQNGIEVDRFLHASRRDLRAELSLPPGSFLVGFLGRFMWQKGIRYLVGALEHLRSGRGREGMPTVLTFSEQDGFYREEMEDVRRRGLGDVIRFMPFVSDVGSTLKGLDVVVMPSLWEACPLLPMEAMVAGVPIIATDCIGLREVVRHTPASVVSARDSVALSNALLAEMERPSVANARSFATEAASRFDVRARAAELEKLLLGVLEANERRSPGAAA
jgi:glycosyltransferase involved in cell wall biosynthesis